MNSASLCSLVGRYDNPIPTRFLAPIDCLKIPALYASATGRIRMKPLSFAGLLKVPKREIFVTELIILSHPICIGDLRTKAKNRLFAILFFYRWLSVR